MLPVVELRALTYVSVVWFSLLMVVPDPIALSRVALHGLTHRDLAVIETGLN